MGKVKNYGRSVRDRLLVEAKHSGMPYQMLLIRYMQERLLFRLAQSEYREHFILKGGALLYAYTQMKARPTLDVDFLGLNIGREEHKIRLAFETIANISCLEDGVVFDAENIDIKQITINREYHGVRVRLTARLDSIVQPVSIDIGFGDVVTPCAQALAYPLTLASMPQAHILAYSLENVVAEKFEAMIALGRDNSRMKDFFDVYIILTTYQLDETLLQTSIRETFIHRSTQLAGTPALFTDDFATSSPRIVMWNAFLRKINSSLPLGFTEVVAYITERLRPYLPS
ncbi:MAG: nucleotidyl transferase AbiEii/AbiGii toxin family protein [Akkermansia sp.]|nr:nucleotidyl transferase AbiEii/AbiGii toxin family protein [Akkermansia sp.]